MKTRNVLKYKTIFLATLLAATSAIYAEAFPACPDFTAASQSFQTLPTWVAGASPANYNLYQTPPSTSGDITLVYNYFVNSSYQIDTVAKAIPRIRYMSGFLSNAGNVEYVAADVSYKQCLYYGKIAADSTPQTPQVLSIQYSQPMLLPTIAGTDLAIPSTVLQGARYQAIYTLTNQNDSTLYYQLIKNSLAEITFLQPVFNACDVSGNSASLAANQSCNLQMIFDTASLAVGQYQQSVLNISLANSANAPAKILTVDTMIEPNNFHNFIVFGDSLSDNGDNGGPYTNPADPAHGGQYNWAQDLARDGLFPNKDLVASKNLGTLNPVNTNLDFAIGGARTNGLAAQIASYHTLLNGANPDANTVVFIWMGGNDYLMFPGFLPNINTIITNMMAGINAVHDLGIAFDHIYILNLTDLSQIPALNGTTPDKKAAIAQSVLNYNALLASTIQTQTPGVHVTDVHSFNEAAMTNPSVYGMDASLLHVKCSGAAVDGNCIGYLSWDGIHPTTTAHQEIANYVASHLNY